MDEGSRQELRDMILEMNSFRSIGYTLNPIFIAVSRYYGGVAHDVAFLSAVAHVVRVLSQNRAHRGLIERRQQGIGQIDQMEHNEHSIRSFHLSISLLHTRLLR